MAFRGFTGNLNKKTPTNDGPYRYNNPARPTKVNLNQFNNQPIAAGQSMAMAGNTGLAGLTNTQISNIIAGQKNLNKFNQNTNTPTYKSLGQQIGEMGSKYRRPANIDKYAADMAMLNAGIAAGGSFFTGPDGIDRFNFNKTGLKNDLGQTILSRQLPALSASMPSLGETFGDISRAFTGYDSLKYVDDDFQGPFPLSGKGNIPPRDLPYMQTTPGLLSGVGDYITGGGVVGKILGGAQDLYNKGIGAFKGESQYDKPSPQKKDDAKLSPLQTVIYDALIQAGKTPSEAYASASRQNFATGGIASLN